MLFAIHQHESTSLVAQLIKNLLAVQETRVQSLGWEDPPEKEMGTHFSIAWKISWIEEPGGLQSEAVRVGHDLATKPPYTCVPSYPEPPSHLPPQPIPLGCPRAPALDALLHASNLHWSSILYGDIPVALLFSQIIPPLASPTVSKSVLYVCVSFATLHVGLSVLSF